MTDNEIQEKNKLIAVFMGGIQDRETKLWGIGNAELKRFGSTMKVWAKEHYKTEDLRYNSSWEWLMPVVVKIGTEFRFKTRFHLSGFPINVTISGSGGTHIAINQGNCAGEEYKGERLITDTMNLNYFINDESMQYKPIELIWIAIVQFVQWSNKTDNKNKV